VTVISDSSPLITLAKIGRLVLLPQLYQAIAITPQVYDEIVVSGAGLVGSVEVAAAKWIDVRPIKNQADLIVAQRKFGIGIGELSTIILGIEANAGLLLIDEIKARNVAMERGLAVLGCVGVLEDAFILHLLSDLPQAYRQLLSSGAYIDPRILDSSLRALNLPPL
jgi:predicted nucleic acid-binding protein